MIEYKCLYRKNQKNATRIVKNIFFYLSIFYKELNYHYFFKEDIYLIQVFLGRY